MVRSLFNRQCANNILFGPASLPYIDSLAVSENERRAELANTIEATLNAVRSNYRITNQQLASEDIFPASRQATVAPNNVNQSPQQQETKTLNEKQRIFTVFCVATMTYCLISILSLRSNSIQVFIPLILFEIYLYCFTKPTQQNSVLSLLMLCGFKGKPLMKVFDVIVSVMQILQDLMMFFFIFICLEKTVESFVSLVNFKLF